MEAFMYRYTDRMHKIRQVLDSGVLGEIRGIHSTFRFFWTGETPSRKTRVWAAEHSSTSAATRSISSA